MTEHKYVNIQTGEVYPSASAAKKARRLAAVPRAPTTKPGRPIYVTNADVKSNVIAAFEHLGGVEALVQWGRAKPDKFYEAYIKLAPRDVHVTGQMRQIVVNRLRFDDKDVSDADLVEPVTDGA